jgi:AraC-like DNA-binding protein
MPLSSDHSIAYSSIRILLDHLAERGVEVPAFCASVGLPQVHPDNPDTRVTHEMMGRVWKAAYAVTGTETLALEVGGRGSSSSLGAFGHLLGYSETVERALEAACRYLTLVSGGLRLRLEKTPDGLALSMVNEGTPAQSWQLTVERTFANAVTILKEHTAGKGLPHRADFCHEAPVYAEGYRKWICRDCRFGQKRDRLYFNESVLALPLAHRHQRLRRLFLAEADYQLGVLQSTETFSSRLQVVLSGLLDEGRNTAAEAARRLGLGERTLYRRLLAEHTTFQAQLDEVRRGRCLHLIADQGLSLEQIAFACGFSEASSFFRAFKRWTGKPPSAYRNPRLLGQPPKRQTKPHRSPGVS